ncbi:vesicle coat protein [Tricladium varicosporioides]|nr:vesicle coat protein [Hymenoscyphus varicosporioides]
MASILCLAHYCDTHGPTPLMVTEGLPVGCSTCFDDDEYGSRRQSMSSRSINTNEGVSGVISALSKTSLTSDKENGTQRPTVQTSKSAERRPAIETPPESPRVAALAQSGQSSNPRRRDSSFRKTYDENDKKRAIPCENCALTLPKKTKEDVSAAGKVDNSGPILRTRKPYERVASPLEEPSPPKSASSSSSDSENAITSKSDSRSRPLMRVGTSSSTSSFDSTMSHDHFLDYTSTHEPLAPTSFSIIRQSCLRTLSCETLPPTSAQFINSSPSSPFINSPSSSGPSSTTSTSSGGPIFFGDPLAGYTIAFIFRIPDPNARGRRRVYALMALSTHRERVAMKGFPFLSKAFHELAAWIQGLAEAELERSESMSSPRLGNGDDRGGRQSAFNNTPTSSFLQGRNRSDGKFGMNLRSRGLAELVGLPDFFIELHAKFVRLLIELGVILGS